MSAVENPPAAGRQTLIVKGWHPPQIANGQYGHWTTRRRKKQVTEMVVGTHAVLARWRKVEGRARLTIVLVYPRKYRVDTDNLFSRCKDTVDALKPFIVDDSTDWLDLRVTAVVERGTKATRITLEPLDERT